MLLHASDAEAAGLPWIVSSADLQRDPVVVASTLESAGVLLIRSCCTVAICEACGEEIERRQACQEAEFAAIHDPELRSDCLLEPTGPVRAALLDIVRRCGGVLSERVGAQALLCELSAISSEPGAQQQRGHTDTSLEPWIFESSDTSDHDDDDEVQAASGDDRNQMHGGGTDDLAAAELYLQAVAPLITSFVALSDVSCAMGPTRVWPGTHDAAFHCRLWHSSCAEIEAALHERTAVDCDVRQGDCVLMDSRLWHCGGANTSELRRTLLVASFMGTRGQPPYGSTFSLLEHLTGQLSLSGLIDEAG